MASQTGAVVSPDRACTNFIGRAGGFLLPVDLDPMDAPCASDAAGHPDGDQSGGRGANGQVGGGPWPLREAFWDEGRHPGVVKGRLHTRIRTYKAGRGMGNSVFAYIINPLEAAESMAFNLDCLGAVCWFEYGEIVEKPGVNRPMSEALGPWISFYHKRHDLLREATVVADVGVFRSFPSCNSGAGAVKTGW